MFLVGSAKRPDQAPDQVPDHDITSDLQVLHGAVLVSLDLVEHTAREFATGLSAIRDVFCWAGQLWCILYFRSHRLSRMHVGPPCAMLDTRNHTKTVSASFLPLQLLNVCMSGEHLRRQRVERCT